MAAENTDGNSDQNAKSSSKQLFDVHFSKDQCLFLGLFQRHKVLD